MYNDRPEALADALHGLGVHTSSAHERGGSQWELVEVDSHDERPAWLVGPPHSSVTKTTVLAIGNVIVHVAFKCARPGSRHCVDRAFAFKTNHSSYILRRTLYVVVQRLRIIYCSPRDALQH
jgi:hypothetical protein